MFNFFKKKDVIQEDVESEKGSVVGDEVAAAVTYYITFEGVPFVDVKMCDYDEETVANLSTLLKGIHSGDYFPDTIEMIRDGFIEQGKPELYIAVAAIIGSAIISQTDEQPCINPSDVFKM